MGVSMELRESQGLFWHGVKRCCLSCSLAPVHTNCCAAGSCRLGKTDESRIDNLVSILDG